MSFIKKHSTLVLMIMCILLEIVISNYYAFAVTVGDFNVKELDVASAKVTGKGSEYKDGVLYISGGTIEFDGINEPMANICIAADSDDGQYKKIDVSFTDDNFSYGDGFEYNNGTFYIYEEKGRKSYLRFTSFGEVKSLRITVSSDSVGALAIKSVSINTPQPFHINMLRLVILMGIALIIKFGLWKQTVSENRYGYRILAAAAAGICLLTCICTVMLTKNPNSRLLSAYDPENMYSDDQYEELFYAFTQGKTSLDIDYDISKFDKLDNVYDRSERHEKGISGDFWDRAYYNGHFYCYFGVAPVIEVYYPVYLLTGHVPTPVLASMILAIYAQVFVSLLYIKVIRNMCKDVPLLLAIMGLVALLSGSLILPLAFDFQFYYMAVLSGIGAVAAFLYFLLGAYYTKIQKHRIIYLILAGVSVVGIVAARPTLVVYCLIAFVPAVFIFKDRKIKKKLKLYYCLSLMTPILIGAILLMKYNYVRFGNPFEFGFNYQLTVSIAKANTVTLGMLPAALYHFLFQQPDFSTNFPYFHMRSRTLELYPRYNYNGRLIGILNYPLTWAMFLFPFKERKKDKFKHTLLLSLIIIPIILLFLNMCLAGSHYRYTADVLMSLLLAGMIVMFDILNRMKELSEKLYKRAYIVTAAVLFLTFMVGFLMMYCNETANLMKEYAFMSRIFYKG